MLAGCPSLPLPRLAESSLSSVCRYFCVLLSRVQDLPESPREGLTLLSHWLSALHLVGGEPGGRASPSLLSWKMLAHLSHTCTDSDNRCVSFGAWAIAGYEVDVRSSRAVLASMRSSVSRRKVADKPCAVQRPQRWRTHRFGDGSADHGWEVVKTAALNVDAHVLDDGNKRHPSCTERLKRWTLSAELSIQSAMAAKHMHDVVRGGR